MITFARQSEALKISEEQALEGFFYFTRTRGEKAEKYPDYVKARREASRTLDRLAKLADLIGSDEQLSGWLDQQIERLEQRRLSGEAA